MVSGLRSSNLAAHSRRVAQARSVTPRLLLGLGLCLMVAAAGCSPQTTVAPVVMPDELISPNALIIPGNCPWTDTGIDVHAGEALTVSAKGCVHIGRIKKPKPNDVCQVPPQGTFLYADEMVENEFPLPAAGRGPAPCFCLIGRIGHGPPFFVGEGRSWAAEQTGRLWLGINDCDVSLNTGEFYAEVSKPSDVQPVTFRQEVPLEVPEGAPEPDCSVVVFYVDGLRPDVVEEMAAMHHIPNLRRHFIEGGAYLSNAFTAFPSDTITSNGTMWTGCFSDRHGLKGQVRFSRSRLKSDSFLEPLGPNRSSRLLGTHGLDKVVQDTQASTVGLFHGEEGKEQWRSTQTSGMPAIYDHLRCAGSDWSTGVLPVMTDLPPVMWTRSMARVLPYLRAQQAWRYIDDANTNYAVRVLLRQRRPVTIIWLPETDSVSHKECRGQFGSTRKTIALADRLVGEVVNELEGEGRLDKTYLVLVSDHGHLGGRDTHLSRFDLANEFFFNPRRVSPTGEWKGGGLGMSVRQHRYCNWHKGDTSRDFVFVDGDSDGCARVFLPRGKYGSGDWSGPNSAAQLLSYCVSDNIPPINLPQTIACTRAVDDAGCEQYPVDLVLAKLNDCSILITTADRGQAVIDRQRGPEGQWLYRYTPVENVIPTTDGDVVWQPVASPRLDPLGITPHVRKGFLQGYYDERTWLWLTTMTDYPDSVVVLTRHMLWQDNLKTQEPEYAPDLVVTARHGWLFGVTNTPGTTHGYPLAESMHATWYVSGPNIRRGARIDAPCRLADLTPTILEMCSVPVDPCHFDGTALRNIYDDCQEERLTSVERPMYWNDFDLQAWQSLNYSPSEMYGQMPISMNRPNSGWDMNNIAYNVMTITDWSVFRLVDDIVSPVTPGRTKVAPSVERAEQKVSHGQNVAVAEGATALNVPGVALADYSPTSVGNLKRVDSAVDWVQSRGAHIDQKIAKPIGRRSVLGTRVTNGAIDSIQGGLWETYRFAQRVIIELLDEVVLNGIENGVDSTMNSFRSVPSEIVEE